MSERVLQALLDAHYACSSTAAVQFHPDDNPAEPGLWALGLGSLGFRVQGLGFIGFSVYRVQGLGFIGFRV